MRRGAFRSAFHCFSGCISVLQRVRFIALANYTQRKKGGGGVNSIIICPKLARVRKKFEFELKIIAFPLYIFFV